MPTNVKIIDAREFVRATPGGLLDYEASEKLLLEIAEASRDVEDLDVLLDTRNAMAVLSTMDLWALAQKAAMHGAKTLCKTAVLCPAERFDHAQFFGMCGQQHGLNIRAFIDYEHAMEWLISGDRGQR